jgi:dipeptidyl aminopeptidase/acylaminoacyl peptidase
LTKLDATQGEETHRWPQFLPDGRHVLYFARASDRRMEANVIKVASLDGGPDEVLVHTPANALYASGHLLYIRESSLMAQPFDPSSRKLTGEAFPVADQVQFDATFSNAVFSVSDNGVLVYQTGGLEMGSRLTWFDRSGKELGVLGDRASYWDLDLSPAGDKVAVAITDAKVGPPDLWIYDVTRGLRTRFTFDTRADNWPTWSPDGTKILFASNRGGHGDLFLRPASGAGAEETLLASPVNKASATWSRDGRFVAFVTLGDPNTKADIWVLPLAGDRKPVPFLQSPFNEQDARFSPDGRFIMYRSDESGQGEIYVASFPGPGGKWQVSTAGGVRPRWRRDGKEIFYLARDQRLTAVQVSEQGATLQVGASTPLFRIAAVLIGNGYDVTADGQKFLVNAIPQGLASSPLTLVVNWNAAPKKG